MVAKDSTRINVSDEINVRNFCGLLPRMKIFCLAMIIRAAINKDREISRLDIRSEYKERFIKVSENVGAINKEIRVKNRNAKIEDVQDEMEGKDSGSRSVTVNGRISFNIY